MHVLDLGIAQRLVGAVLLLMIKLNFARSRKFLARNRRHDNIMHLRRRLKSFYDSHPAIKRSRGKRTRIGRLTLKMFCKGLLSAKAAQTRHLVPLAKLLMEENAGILKPKDKFLTIAAGALVSVYTIMNSQPRNMSPSSVDSLQKSMLRFLHFWKGWGGHQVFKHHVSLHLVERVRVHGNPVYYTCYRDEDFNRVNGKIAKSLHGGSTFYFAFLEKALR